MAGIGASPSSTDTSMADGPDSALTTDGAEQATPEEQALYERFVHASGDVMMGDGDAPEFRPEIINNLRGQFDPQVSQMFEGVQPPLNPQSPTDALAATSVIVTMMTEATMAQQGTQVPQEIVYHAGTEVVGQLADAAEAAGIADFSQDDVDNAFLRALDIYRQSSPNVDQQDLASQFDQLVVADREGRLDQVLPGASKLAARSPSQEQSQ